MSSKSIQTNEELARAIPDEVATGRDVDRLGDLLAVDVVEHSPVGEGPFMGIGPTGNSSEVMTLVLTRIEDGRIVERWCPTGRDDATARIPRTADALPLERAVFPSTFAGNRQGFPRPSLPLG